MSGPLTYRQHAGPLPPGSGDASRLPGNYYDSNGKRIVLFGSAYAKLFAASPDLLDSLKAITESFNLTRLIMQDQESRDLAGQLVADARAVIAKAEGR